jgi:hypothetical protein
MSVATAGTSGAIRAGLPWPEGDPGSLADIELPEGRTFESDGDTVHDITLDRRDRIVRNVQRSRSETRSRTRARRSSRCSSTGRTSPTYG